MRRGVGLLVFPLLAVALAAYLHFSLPNIPDRDALYHFRHAALYRERGPFLNEFPWAAYSMIGKLGADIWYGFHLLLTPFTLQPDPVRGVKLAGVFDLAVMLVLLYAAMRVGRFRFPFVWPLVSLAFAPYLLYRLLMTRPHVISTGLAALLLACVVEGRLWGIALTSFAIGWIHLGFFWVIPLVVGVFVLVRRLAERSWAWREALAAALGLIAGWALRPNAFGAAKLAYIQIVQLAIEKQKGVPLLFGADLVSARQAIEHHGLADFSHHFLPALMLWATAAAVLIAAAGATGLSGRQRTMLGSSLALSGVALGMMIFFSLRAVDLLSPFTTMLAAGVHTWVLVAPRQEAGPPGLPARRAVSAIGAALIAVMFFQCGREHARVMPRLGYRPDRLKLAAEWLAENSAPGDIVFQAHWDLFPELFFWNTHNRYVGGMDPIFQYVYEPTLYWKAHHLYTARFSRFTCAEPVCGPSNSQDTFRVLTRDFHAKFLVLEQRRDAALLSYALDDPRFQFVFDDGTIAVFRLVGIHTSG